MTIRQWRNFTQLRPASSFVDSTLLSLEEVIDAICALVPDRTRIVRLRQSGWGCGGRDTVIAGVSPDLPHTA